MKEIEKMERKGDNRGKVCRLETNGREKGRRWKLDGDGREGRGAEGRGWRGGKRDKRWWRVAGRGEGDRTKMKEECKISIRWRSWNGEERVGYERIRSRVTDKGYRKRDDE